MGVEYSALSVIGVQIQVMDLFDYKEGFNCDHADNREDYKYCPVCGRMKSVVRCPKDKAMEPFQGLEGLKDRDFMGLDIMGADYGEMFYMGRISMGRQELTHDLLDEMRVQCKNATSVMELGWSDEEFRKRFGLWAVLDCGF